ncbi:MAG: hypothetical protein BMS9Abin05_1233 [Rhodothermia bacterium]|nr:MAG: hypothetical protein BMS9Abin05_1233 [Rhodothermia bacterium]
MPEPAEGSVLVLNARPLWVRLLFRELGRFVPTTGVIFRLGENDPPVTEFELPEAPGWSLVPIDFPIRSFGRLAALYSYWVHQRLKKRFGDLGVAVFTQPSQRCLCRHFAGTRRIYYVADDYRWGYGWYPSTVDSWERTIIDNVEHVVCVSSALAKSMVDRLHIERERVFVSASGMPESLIPDGCSSINKSPQDGILSEKRPLAGVFGTIDTRVRLDWLRGLVDALPWLNLLIVGPTAELSDDQHKDWRYLVGHARCTIVGRVDYYELFRYASSVEIGLIPLTNKGINPTSSPTRFYTQLAFGQPIVASESSLQLQEFEPLVTIAKTLSEFIQKVEELYLVDFDDHLAERRRVTARHHTWEKRAESFFRELIPQQQ